MCLTLFLVCHDNILEAHILAHIQTDEYANNSSAYIPQAYDTKTNNYTQAHHTEADR
jgi:hypothetical protein